MRKFKFHSLEYVLLRIIEKFLVILPRPVALFLGQSIGFILYLFKIYRKVVLKNMEYVGLWEKREMDKIIFNLYLNIGRYAVDFLRSPAHIPPYTIHNYEIVDPLFAQNRGIIVLLAHFGNWELLAEIFGKTIPNLSVVAKPMRNSKVDNWLAEKRKKTAVTTIYVDQALRKMLESIKRNGMVAILIDQDPGKHGTMVKFLGKDANTVRTVAGIVHKTGCAVLPTYAILRKDNSYDVIIEKADPVSHEGKTDEEIIAAYQLQHNEIISEWIQKNPEHWFGWFHKRFKATLKYK
ncbi:MAG: lysophospholipid acyltransferase family protein [Fibrobacter sp.]|nr:lysophospholipid acyltransferase family protein [Fibrobacter sp.]